MCCLWGMHIQWARWRHPSRNYWSSEQHRSFCGSQIKALRCREEAWLHVHGTKLWRSTWHLWNRRSYPVAGASFIAKPQNKGIQGYIRDFLYCRLLGAGIRGSSIAFWVYPMCGYLHHLPAVEGRFPGRRGEGEERVLGRLWPRLGDPDLLLGGSGRRLGSVGSGMLPGMSSTTGGWSARGMRQVAAASGRAAPISRWTSGRAARGGVCAWPDVLFTAVRASL